MNCLTIHRMRVALERRVASHAANDLLLAGSATGELHALFMAINHTAREQKVLRKLANSRPKLS